MGEIKTCNSSKNGHILHNENSIGKNLMNAFFNFAQENWTHEAPLSMWQTTLQKPHGMVQTRKQWKNLSILVP